MNQRLASILWPDARAVGHQILIHTDEQTPRLVVGVIADAKQARYENAVQPEYIVPLAQSPRRQLSFVVKERAPLSRETIQSQLAAVDPNIPTICIGAVPKRQNPAFIGRDSRSGVDCPSPGQPSPHGVDDPRS